MSMLELNRVKKSFGDHPVIRDISLSVDPGDVVAILGPSGSGKTTLLRCAGYLSRADGGTVTLDGETFDLHQISRKDVVHYRRKIGFVFQTFNLFGNKTALQNVTAGLTIARGMDKKEAERIGLEALKKVGLLDRKDYYPSKLSGGQQQRVAIARAIAPNPRVIFFDEPTSALDPELTEEVLNVMKNLAEDGITMILVTHEIEFAQRVANRVILIEDGLIVEENDADSFFLHPQQTRTIEFLCRTRWKPEGEMLNDEGVI